MLILKKKDQERPSAGLKINRIISFRSSFIIVSFYNLYPQDKDSGLYVEKLVDEPKIQPKIPHSVA